MSDCPGGRATPQPDARSIPPSSMVGPETFSALLLTRGTYLGMYVCYQGTKSLPPTTVCDSATLFDTILVCAVLCRAQRSEAAPTWLPSLWSRTRRCPAPYPTAAPLAAPPANHGLRNPCVCLPPPACQPTPAGPDVSLPCLCLSALGLLSAVQPGVLGRIFAADDWAPS
jgi:hypothetical protein